MRFASLTTINRALFLVLAALVLPGSGCKLMQSTAELPGRAVSSVTPGRADKQVVDPVQLQQQLLRFADEFSATMINSVEKLRHGTNALSPAETLKWKIIFTSQASSIAAGPNALANLLDMTVFVTVARTGVEDYWVPKVYGASAQPMLEDCRQLETKIWLLTSTVLPPEQQAELREAIHAWRQDHPDPGDVLGVRVVGFATEIGKSKKADASKPGSVFALLRLDPLSGLDPATREIAQTRLFAERALYIAQWMPTLLRWQTELLSLNAMAMPEVQQLVASSTQIAAAAGRFAAVAEKLPGQVSIERAEILKALQAQEKDVAALLTSGTQMSDSLNTTITTFDALMQRFGVGETNITKSVNTNATPFNILDYAQTAAQLATTAEKLTELVRTLNETTGSNNLTRISAQLTPVVQQAQTGGKEVVDYAFWRGVLLVIIGLGAALVYRFISVRLTAGSTRAPKRPEQT